MTEIPRSNASFVDPLSQWDAEVTQDEETDTISPVIAAKPPNQRKYLTSSSSVILKSSEPANSANSSEPVPTEPKLIRSHTISGSTGKEIKHSRHLSFTLGTKDRIWHEEKSLHLGGSPPLAEDSLPRSQSQISFEPHSPETPKPVNVDKVLKDLLTRETYEEDEKKKQIFQQLTGGHTETLFNSRPLLSSSSIKDTSMFRSDELPTPASIIPNIDKKKDEETETSLNSSGSKPLSNSGNNTLPEPEDKRCWGVSKAIQTFLREKLFPNLFQLKKNEKGQEEIDMDHFSSIMDENIGLFAGISLAYLVGLLGLSVLWVLFLAYMIFRTFNNRLTFIETETQVIKSMTKKTHRRSSSKTVTFGSSIEQKHIGEDCEWLNVMFREMWKNISPNMSQVFRNVFANIAQNYVQTKNPRGIYAIEIVHFDLDQVSPTFEDIVCSKSLIPHVDCELEMMMKYKGPGRMIVNLILGTDTKRLKIPLILEDLTLSGKLHLDFTFFQKSPFLHTLSYCFSTMPEFDIHVRPLSTVNLTWIPIAKEWIRDLFMSAFKKVLVMPVKLSLSYHKLFPARDVRTDGYRHQMTIERAISDGVYEGSLHVKILEARKLPSDFLEDINPYVILSFGDQLYTSKMIVKNKNPIYNEFWEFVVRSDKPRTLEVNMMSRDEQVGDKLLGQCVFDSFLADAKSVGVEAVETWTELSILTKKGRKGVGADIKLQLRYVPDPSKLNATSQSPGLVVNRV